MKYNGAFTGWLIGWFVILSPIHYYFPHGIIWSLIHGIIGVGMAIYFLEAYK